MAGVTSFTFTGVEDWGGESGASSSPPELRLVFMPFTC